MAFQANVGFSNLRAEMARKGITVQEIADSIGVNRDTASRKLSRKSSFTLDEAFKIERQFFGGLGVLYLFSEANTDNPEPQA